MPNKIYLPAGDSGESSGISISWTQSTECLYISGWYDSFVGIEGTSMTLQELIDKLGIKDKTIKKLKGRCDVKKNKKDAAEIK